MACFSLLSQLSLSDLPFSLLLIILIIAPFCLFLSFTILCSSWCLCCPLVWVALRQPYSTNTKLSGPKGCCSGALRWPVAVWNVRLRLVPTLTYVGLHAVLSGRVRMYGQSFTTLVRASLCWKRRRCKTDP